MGQIWIRSVLDWISFELSQFLIIPKSNGSIMNRVSYASGQFWIGAVLNWVRFKIVLVFNTDQFWLKSLGFRNLWGPFSWQGRLMFRLAQAYLLVPRIETMSFCLWNIFGVTSFLGLTMYHCYHEGQNRYKIHSEQNKAHDFSEIDSFQIQVTRDINMTSNDEKWRSGLCDNHNLPKCSRFISRSVTEIQYFSL